MYVSIGGIEQYLHIGEEAPNRSIMLLLHGGPGGTTRIASGAWKPWEEHFTLVHWDQRGAGRTFAKNGEAGCGPLSIDRMARDGIELTEFLLERFNQRQLVLLGHSWGSALGVHMLRHRPELFSAFVGTSQLVNWRESHAHNYRRGLAKAERIRLGEAVKALRDLGPPPFLDLERLKRAMDWADRLADGDGDPIQMQPPARPVDFSPEDGTAIMQGFAYSTSQLFGELDAVDLLALGFDFPMPFFVFQGTADPVTPCELAEAYFARITAPHKAFVRFENCHHFVAMNRPDDFLRALLAHVSPQLESS